MSSASSSQTQEIVSALLPHLEAITKRLDTMHDSISILVSRVEKLESGFEKLSQGAFSKANLSANSIGGSLKSSGSGASGSSSGGEHNEGENDLDEDDAIVIDDSVQLSGASSSSNGSIEHSPTIIVSASPPCPTRSSSFFNLFAQKSRKN